MVRHTTTQRWKHWKAVSGAGRVKDAPFVLACDRDPGAHAAGAALPRAGVRRPARRAAARVVRPARRSWPRTGSTWNVAATAGSGPRTPTSAAPTWPGCRAGWPTPTRRRRCTARRPWGPVSVTGTPVALTPAERAAYDSEWSEFRAEMQLARAVAAEREGPGGAAAVPAEGRADPRAGHGRLGEGAGRGRAAGRGVGRVRRDRGRPDPRGAARRRHRGGRHLRARPVRRRGRAAALPARRGAGLRVHRDRLDQPARRRAAARRADRVGDAAGRPVPPAAVLRHPGPPGHRPHPPRRPDLAVADRVRRGHRRGAGRPGDGRAAGGQRLGGRRGHVVAAGDRRTARRRLAAGGRPDRGSVRCPRRGRRRLRTAAPASRDLEHCEHLVRTVLPRTKSELRSATSSCPASGSNFQEGRVSNNIYFTALVRHGRVAERRAGVSPGRPCDRRRICVVEPLGPFERPQRDRPEVPGNVSAVLAPATRCASSASWTAGRGTTPRC